MVIEGKRWLDDAFACAGEADERTRALALTGRGLLDFLAGVTRAQRRGPGSGARDLRAPRRRRSRWRWRTRSTPSSPPRCGDIDEARRRRQSCSTSTASRPDDPFAVAARVVLAGEARGPGRRPRRGGACTTAPRPRASPSSTGRSCSRSCLGMVADFDERAGDYPAAITRARGRHRDQRRRCSAASPGRCWPASAGCCSTRARSARAEAAYQRALDVGSPGAPHDRSSSCPRRHGRRCTGSTAATTTRSRRPPRRWSSTGPADLRRFRNRVDPKTDLQAAAAVCCVVLAAIAAERDDPERAATLLGQAERLRADAGVEVPAFQHDDVDQAGDRDRGAGRRRVRRRPSTEGRPADAGSSARPLSRSGSSAATRRQVSALLDGGGRPAQPRARPQEDP